MLKIHFLYLGRLSYTSVILNLSIVRQTRGNMRPSQKWQPAGPGAENTSLSKLLPLLNRAFRNHTEEKDNLSEHSKPSNKTSATKSQQGHQHCWIWTWQRNKLKRNGLYKRLYGNKWHKINVILYFFSITWNTPIHIDKSFRESE